jgi:hypothetical protein
MRLDAIEPDRAAVVDLLVERERKLADEKPVAGVDAII